MSRGSRGNQSDAPNSEAEFWTWAILGAFVLGGGWLIWHFCRAQTLTAILAPAWLQLFVMDKLGYSEPRTAQWLAWVTGVISGRVPADSITTDQLVMCLTRITNLTAWFYTLAFLIPGMLLMLGKRDSFTHDFSLGGYIYQDKLLVGKTAVPDFIATLLKPLHNLSSNYRAFEWVNKLFQLSIQPRRVRDGANFIAYQAKAWPQMTCVVDFDPTDCITALTDGLRPEDWAAQKEIISKQNAARLKYRKPLEDLGPIPWDRQKARVALAAQLAAGGPWKGIEQAPVHIQALLLMAFANRRISSKITGQIAGKCSAAAKPLFDLRAAATRDEIIATRNQVLEKLGVIVKRFMTSERITGINELAQGHVYNRSAALAVVAQSGPNRDWGGGTYGVLQSSLFLWMKPIDRCMFFCCQAIGGASYPAEAAGVISHWQAERLAKDKGLPNPQIWVEGAMRWYEGFFDRGENGPSDAEIPDLPLMTDSDLAGAGY